MQIIKKLREDAKYTLQDVADRTGLSMGLINGYEHGTMSNPKFKTVEALATCFPENSDLIHKEAGRIPIDIFRQLANSKLTYAQIREVLNAANI